MRNRIIQLFTRAAVAYLRGEPDDRRAEVAANLVANAISLMRPHFQIAVTLGLGYFALVTALSGGRAEARLRAWLKARLPPQRDLSLFLLNLVIIAYFDDPETFRELDLSFNDYSRVERFYYT